MSRRPSDGVIPLAVKNWSPERVRLAYAGIDAASIMGRHIKIEGIEKPQLVLGIAVNVKTGFPLITTLPEGARDPAHHLFACDRGRGVIFDDDQTPPAARHFEITDQPASVNVQKLDEFPLGGTVKLSDKGSLSYDPARQAGEYYSIVGWGVVLTEDKGFVPYVLFAPTSPEALATWNIEQPPIVYTVDELQQHGITAQRPVVIRRDQGGRPLKNLDS